MKRVGILFGYAIIIAGLSIAFFGPLIWLFTPDPTLRLEPGVAAPLPPRIAESVDRKRAPVVQPERVAPATEKPVALPEMNEAPAALPEKQVSVALPVEPAAKRHAPRQAARKPRPPAERHAREFIRWRTPPATTARTDFPY